MAFSHFYIPFKMSSHLSLLGGRLVRKPCAHRIDEKKEKLWHCHTEFIWAHRCHVHSQFRVKMNSSGYLIQRTGFFPLNLFYWSIVDLQYCVIFYCTANRFSYTYNTHFLKYSFPLCFITGYWTQFPALYSGPSYIECCLFTPHIIV